MGIGGVDHIYVETRHFDRTKEFWEALGFATVAEWGEEGHRACKLAGEGAQVVLAGVGPDHAPQRPTVHLKLTDAERTDEALAAAEVVTVVTPLEATHWNTRWIRIQDPDGNVYALEETGPASNPG
jgi:catechol 2,3-dioxygenase-like lactoylglutathione lyase family enzyme